MCGADTRRERHHLQCLRRVNPAGAPLQRDPQDSLPHAPPMPPRYEDDIMRLIQAQRARMAPRDAIECAVAHDEIQAGLKMQLELGQGRAAALRWMEGQGWPTFLALGILDRLGPEKLPASQQ
jgi:hypothetical protein